HVVTARSTARHARARPAGAAAFPPLGERFAPAPIVRARRCRRSRPRGAVKAPESRAAVLVTLARRLARFRGRVLVAVALLVVAKIAAVSVPIMLKAIVDALSRPETLLTLPVALLAGYAAVRFSTTLFGELRDLVFVRASQSTVADYTVGV